MPRPRNAGQSGMLFDSENFWWVTDDKALLKSFVRIHSILHQMNSEQNYS